MKKIVLLAVLVLSSQLLFAAEKADKYSALNALKVAANVVPQNVRSKLVRIVGENGKLHPTVWRVVFYDPTATMDMRVVTVSKGEVTANEQPFAIFEQINWDSCMDLHDIKLDSKEVINVIHRLCYDNKIPLYFMDVRLEKSQKGNVTPLWICTLKNARNNALGVISVSAKTGKILETEDLELTQDSKLRAEKSFGQSFVDTFLGVGANMEEFFTGKRTVDQ